MKKTYINWSGGKDSSLALFYILQQKKHTVSRLLTSVNAAHNRVSMHGVRRDLLKAQAVSLRIELATIELPEQPGMAEYEIILSQKVNELKLEGFEVAIFGDIFLADLRKYREENLAPMGITAAFPLWEIDTRFLISEFIRLGFKAIVVCINEKYLDKSFCGRIIDQQFVDDLPDNVDKCGEHGEFHSFVFDGPLFNKPVLFTKGEMVYKSYPAPGHTDTRCSQQTDTVEKEYGFWFCDLY